jgi:aerobic carbon-monoxide dehydrogenase medium subunit
MSAMHYHRPDSLSAAVELLGEDAALRALGGGQTILPAMKLGLLATSGYVDLGRLRELRGISIRDGTVRIGAMTTHAEVSAAAEVRQAIPALAQLAGNIGDRAVRNRGTIGGSLANSDPAADYPAAVLGLGAMIETDRRRIGADRFFRGLFDTALEQGELLTAIGFPIPERAAYVKFKQPASRFALVGVFVAQRAGSVRVAVTGAGPCVFRVESFESALAERFAPEACDGISVSAAGLTSDLHGSADYRAHLISVLAKRAVAQALA